MSKPLTVGELKKWLDRSYDDAIVLQSGPDHSYYEVSPQFITVYKEDGIYFEDYGEQESGFPTCKALVFD